MVVEHKENGMRTPLWFGWPLALSAFCDASHFPRSASRLGCSPPDANFGQASLRASGNHIVLRAPASSGVPILGQR